MKIYMTSQAVIKLDIDEMPLVEALELAELRVEEIKEGIKDRSLEVLVDGRSVGKDLEATVTSESIVIVAGEFEAGFSR